MITLEREQDRALGVRPNASAVSILPATLLPDHRARMRDALARRAAAFIR